MSTSSIRNKLPLILLMLGGLLFALGMRTLGLIATGLGALLYATGLHKASPE